MRFTLQDVELNLTSGTIVKNNQSQPIRAKTLLVLRYLIEHRTQIVTKHALLDAIWHDVVVQEQVLVQSIKEIRDLLGSDVIKTYPRQGYQWVAILEAIEAPPLKINKRFKPQYIILIIATLSIVIISALLLTTQFPPQVISASATQQEETQAKAQQLTIAFLPVENDMPDTLHQHIPFKGMDYLSQNLAQQSALSVINTDNLLFAMSRIKNLANSEQDKKVYLLQKKLGADLIVKTRLRGFPQDFQLHYTLYSPHSVERGVEFADNINTTFDQLIKKISQRFSHYKNQPPISYQSDFSNEAFANGIEYYLKRDHHNAITFFTTALHSNPSLLAARRYLAASHANSGDVDQGINLLRTNILAAQQHNDQREEMRGHLMIGYLLINWPQDKNNRRAELTQAEQHIELGLQLAQQHQDQLFIAYTHEELGKIKRLQKQYTEAVKLLSTALKYHQNFRGRYGQTTALIELARVASEEGNNTLTEYYFNQAQSIADNNGAAMNKVWILLARAEIKRQQGFREVAKQLAQEAMEIALASKNQHLIHRVNAWLNNTPIYDVN